MPTAFSSLDMLGDLMKMMEVRGGQGGTSPNHAHWVSVKLRAIRDRFKGNNPVNTLIISCLSRGQDSALCQGRLDMVKRQRSHRVTLGDKDNEPSVLRSPGLDRERRCITSRIWSSRYPSWGTAGNLGSFKLDRILLVVREFVLRRC